MRTYFTKVLFKCKLFSSREEIVDLIDLKFLTHDNIYNNDLMKFSNNSTYYRQGKMGRILRLLKYFVFI